MTFHLKLNFLLFILLITGTACNTAKDTDAIISNETELSVKFVVNNDNRDLDTRQTNKLINSNNLSFFLFEKDSKGNTSFVFSPEKQSVTVDKTTSEKEYIANFKIPGKNFGEVVLITLANYNGNEPSYGEALHEFQENNLIITYNGVIDYSIKPMWGISYFVTDSNKLETEVTLIRNLARIDFEILNSKTKSNFKIESINSVRIYRTLNKASLYIKEKNLDSQGKVISPTIPKNTEYNLNNGASTSSISEADQDPLVYDFSSQPVTKIENEIFIPEVVNPSDALRSEVATLVIGVFLDNDKYRDQERFYRVDFANYTEGDLKPKDLFSVIRNYSYLFQLNQAINSGENKAEDALNAKSGIWIQVQKWENSDMESIINGQYYFSIESSDIKLSYEKGDITIIPFKSNMNDGELEEAIIARWNDNQKLSQYFEFGINIANKVISIKTKKSNPTANQISEILHLTVLNHLFTFKVTQLHKTADYIISQNHYSVQGVYVRNKELISGVNTATVRLYAAHKSVDLRNLKYHLKAEPVQGIYVEVEGLFNSTLSEENGLQYQEITFDVKGMSSEPKDKYLTLVTDGIDATFLNLKIPYAYRPKTILGLFGTNSTNKLSNNTEFQRLIKSKRNFGTDITSTVKIETITYEETSNTNINEVINQYRPDIIIWGDDYDLSASQINCLTNYINSINDLGGPGVVLGMNSSKSIMDLLKEYNAITNNSAIHDFSTITGDDFRPINPEHPKNKYRYRLPVYDWDKVVNGVFGSIGTKYVSLRKSDICVSYLQKENVLKYTGNLAFGQWYKRFDFGDSMFRLAHHALFWVGSDHFLQDEWFFGPNDKIENANEKEYTCTQENPYKMIHTSNGFLFANLLDWAMYTSEYGLK